MILLTLVSLWALIRGQITIAPKLKLVGRQARIYGGILLAFAIILFNPIVSILDSLLGLSEANSSLRGVFNFVFVITVLVSLAFVAKRIQVPPPPPKDG